MSVAREGVIREQGVCGQQETQREGFSREHVIHLHHLCVCSRSEQQGEQRVLQTTGGSLQEQRHTRVQSRRHHSTTTTVLAFELSQLITPHSFTMLRRRSQLCVKLSEQTQ